MPYTSTPPILCSASKIVTWCPSLIRSPATVSPAGPPPTIATFLPVGGEISRQLDLGLARFPVGEKSLQTPDGDLPAFLDQRAAPLALLFLRTDPPADGGEAVLLFENANAVGKIALRRRLDEAGDVDLDRAAFDAVRARTLQAAHGFFDRGFGRIPERHLVEVVASHVVRLLGHLPAVQIEFFFGGFGDSIILPYALIMCSSQRLVRRGMTSSFR